MKIKKNIAIVSILIFIFVIFYLITIINKKTSSNKEINLSKSSKVERNPIQLNKEDNSFELKNDIEKKNIDLDEKKSELNSNETNLEKDQKINDENEKKQATEKLENKKEITSKELKDKIFSLNKDEGDIFLGNENSDVMIFEYTSITCPHCKKFHYQIFPRIKNEFIEKNKILYVIRDFPTDTISFRSSLIFLRIQNLFDEKKRMNLRELLMSNQDKITQAIYENRSNPKEAFNAAMKIVKEIFMVSIGISEEEFDKYTNLELPETKKFAESIISRIEELSKFLGEESGAPTFLIFNKKTGKFKKIEGIKQIDEWEIFINEIS